MRKTAANANRPRRGQKRSMNCEKNRYGAVADIVTRFDPTVQTFTPAVALSGLGAFDAATPARPSKAKGG